MSSESPTGIGTSACEVFTLITAMSYVGERPTRLAPACVPSEKTTRSCWPSAASATTWLFVITSPSSSRTNPEPIELSSPLPTRIITVLGRAAAATPTAFRVSGAGATGVEDARALGVGSAGLAGAELAGASVLDTVLGAVRSASLEPA